MALQRQSRSKPGPRFLRRHTTLGCICILTLLMLEACSPAPVRSRPEGTQTPETDGLRVAPPPAAYWRVPGERGRGEPIHHDQLELVMIEIAGTTALRETVLDRLLEQELTRRKISLDPGAEQREEALLLSALDPDEDRARLLLERVRVREGLGPVRFTALLRRNASLRALVQDDVEIRDEAVRAAWDRNHGPRRVARVLVIEDLQAASGLMRRIKDGESFGELAARFSTDASASTGGLIDPVSRFDPSWPSSFREVLFTLEPEQVSPPVLVQNNYVLVKYIEEQPGDDTPLEEARAESEELVRRAQERLLMDATARQMLDGVQIDVIDAELDRTWRMQDTPSGSER